MEKNYYLELIQSTFSTLLLDAIQYFPENSKKVHYESSGLLFGVESGEQMECDYVFPVGSVEKRTSSSILTNPKVDQALKSSRQLFSTSTFIGTYHSHPYEEYFPDWCCPSNADVLYSLNNKFPYEVIIAMTRNSMEDKPLTIEFYEGEGYEYIHNSKREGNSAPDLKKLGYKTAYLIGEFQKYKFEIRAFQFTGKSLIDIDLESSEAELLSLLQQEEIHLNEIDQKDISRLRKMEYNLRTKQANEKSESNLQYHLSKLKVNS
ncbi:hypothetical protein [Litchfieldia alkalitelluris]|uniref:hypothetical protein n=1 Tax=Litchfieldia alkalitelluris TaxID=304268 RepID=UPI000997D270|nr:hypothetical protein [Litchfieldia alkalitelluris]